MKLLGGYLVILACYGLGEVIARLLGWPVPGAIYGLLILFTVLCTVRSASPTQLAPVNAIFTAAGQLIRLLALLLLPATVGIYFLPDEFRPQIPAILAGILIATPLSMCLTAVLMKILLSRSGARQYTRGN